MENGPFGLMIYLLKKTFYIFFNEYTPLFFIVFRGYSHDIPMNSLLSYLFSCPFHVTSMLGSSAVLKARNKGST